MIRFAETPRLSIRTLERKDVPTLAELLNNAAITKWLSRVPFPYTLEMAEDWQRLCQKGYDAEEPAFFALTNKKTDALMGGIGLHEPAVCASEPGACEIGYWLGEAFWQKGFVSEALPCLLEIGFHRRAFSKILAATDPLNKASQALLTKAHFTYLGIGPAIHGGLRGPHDVTRWELSRATFDKLQNKENA